MPWRDGFVAELETPPSAADNVTKLTTSLRTLNGIFNINFGVLAMNERIARLQALQNNIARYEGLLKSKLNAVELRFIRRRLSEEQKALAVMQLMNPSDPSGIIQLPLPDIAATTAPPRFRSEA